MAARQRWRWRAEVHGSDIDGGGVDAAGSSSDGDDGNGAYGLEGCGGDGKKGYFLFHDRRREKKAGQARSRTRH